jgi:hypothetical protein
MASQARPPSSAAKAPPGASCCTPVIGFRDLEKSRRAWGEIYEACRKGVRIDRYGISLDWAWVTPGQRQAAVKGTGILLSRPEDFVRLTEVAPVAPHFGDFIMGFPAAVENTCAALAAGATAVGNLGQYFTFRLPNWDDDVATTTATVTALALLAAQEEEVLVHSNLDDGFSGLFTDLASVFGFVLIERAVIETLLGARLSHCWGHHFSDPERRLAFHLALSAVNPTPGTMIYGNTVSYRGETGATPLVDGGPNGQTVRPCGQCRARHQNAGSPRSRRSSTSSSLPAGWRSRPRPGRSSSTSKRRRWLRKRSRPMAGAFATMSCRGWRRRASTPARRSRCCWR